MEPLDELIQLLKERGDQKSIKNILLISKNYLGKLKTVELTSTNYKIRFNGDISEREKAFKLDILRFKDKYSIPLLEAFYNHWSEHTQDDKSMKWEKEKTWETGKRLSTWFSRQQSYNGR